MITASTRHKEQLFRDRTRLALLDVAIMDALQHYGWEAQAWAIFANHYHLIAKSPDTGTSLKPMIQRIHSESSRELNVMDGRNSRQVWFNFWDTCLTFEKSYLARLNYVHNNPVKHGMATVAENYEFCSAAWFKAHSPADFRRKVESFKYDSVKVFDDF